MKTRPLFEEPPLAKLVFGSATFAWVWLSVPWKPGLVFGAREPNVTLRASDAGD